MRLNKTVKIELFAVILFFIISLIIIIKFGIVFFNSDTASVNVYIREELNEGSYFPKNWYNGEELLILTPHTIMLLLVKLGISAYSSRIIGDIIIQTLLVLSIVALSQLVFSELAVSLMTAVLIVSNLSMDYTTFLTCQGSYSVIIILTYICLILLFMSMNKELKIYKTWIYILFLLFLGFCSIMGLRYIQGISLPLLMSFFIIIVDHVANPERATDKSRKYQIQYVKMIGTIIIVSAIGYFIYIKLCQRMVINSAWGGNNAFSFFKLTPLDQLDEKFFSTFETFLSLSGYESGVALLSGKSIISLIKLAMLFLMTIMFPTLLMKNYYQLTERIKLYSLFSVSNFLITFCIVMFSNLSDNIGSGRYFIVSSVFMWSLGCYYIYYKYGSKETIMLFIKTALILTVFLNYCILVKDLHFKKPKIEHQYDSVIAELKNDDLTFGYASFWNSHLYTVYSDFDIEVAPVKIAEDNIMKLCVLSVPESFEESYHSGKTFLLLTKEEDKIARNIEKSVLEKSTGRKKLADYYLYVFDNNIVSDFE